MAVKFNPFSGQLQIDEKGSGGASYIDGEVAVYADLPLSSTTAPLNTAWLVRGSSGIWPFTKPGGVYVRTATGGSLRDADYTYAGIFPDVFSDANFTLYDDGDTSKNLKFQLSGISANTTRTLTAPNSSGTIALTSDIPAAFNPAAPGAIGGTTPSSGAFTTLSASSTVSGTGFSNYLASPPAIGGTSAAAGSFTTLSASTSLTLGTSGILSGGTNTIEQRNTTSAQTFRIYNTVSGAADANHERLFLRWNANVAEIGTEGAGTGNTTRELRLFCGTNEGIRIQTGAVLIRRTSLSINNASITNGTGADDELGFSLNLRPFSTGNVIINSGLVKFHGTTSSFPALKRSSTTLQVRLADDSAFAPLQCSTLVGSDNGTVATLGASGEFRLTSTGQLAFASRGAVLMSADGVMWLSNNAGTSFGRLIFGGTTSSFPALKRSSATLQVRLGDDSGFATIDGQLQMEGTAPATSGATGTAGDIRYDADYIYVCTAANTWKRVAIATW